MNTTPISPTELAFEGADEMVVTRDMHDWVAEFVWVIDFAIQDDELSDDSQIGFRLRPKTRRQLVSGLYYTRDLGASIEPRGEEAYHQYDY